MFISHTNLNFKIAAVLFLTMSFMKLVNKQITVTINNF